jgi:hypothetical protein
MNRSLIVSFAIIVTSTLAYSACPNQYSVLEVGSSRECSSGNPEYNLLNSTGNNYVGKVCTDIRGVGTASRAFKDVTLAPNQSVVLGCRYENGQTQRFSVHWQQSSPCAIPQNITIANSSIEIKRSGIGWAIYNYHHFKTVQVDYSYLGKNFVDTIRPHSVVVALGPSTSPPAISRMVYTVDYPDSASCISTLDQYPIPLPSPR